MASVNKVQSASLNNKRCYFFDGIVSLPFEHPFFSAVREYKNAYRKYIPQSKRKKKHC